MAAWAIFWQIVMYIVTSAISASSIKVPRGGDPVGTDKFQAPTASENRGIPMVLGTRWQKGPNCVWLGDVKPSAVEQSAGRRYGFFGPKRYTTINYLYAIGMHLVLCHRADRIKKIRVGDKDVAMVEVVGNATRAFNEPDLFGGTKSGGGLICDFNFEFGGDTQVPNPYLVVKAPGPIPGHRGVVGVVVKAESSVASPPQITASPPDQGVHVPHIAALVRCIESATSWYQAKVAIGDGINPAHAIRAIMVRSAWNNSQYMDGDMGASFTATADTLHSEGFGIALTISDDELTAEDALREIQRHIDCSIYEDKRTGKVELKLNRGGYSIPSLPLFSDDAGVINVDQYTRTGWGERVNQVAVSYYDLNEDRERTTTPIQNPLGIDAQGGVVGVTIPYPFVLDGTIATRLAERDMLQRSSDLALATLICNRTASGLSIGDLFRWSSPDHGVTEIVMRVKEIAYGSLANGQVRIVAVQDIFSLPQASYSTPPPSNWVPPINNPVPVAIRRVIEAPFWFTGPGAFSPSTSGTFIALGAPPTTDALYFDGWAGPVETGETVIPEAAWSERATLSTSIGQAATSWSVSSGITKTGLALIGNEIVNITSAGTTLAVQRGMLDTVPMPFASGTQILTMPGNLANDAYANAASVGVRMLTATLRGTLPVASAPEDILTLSMRHIRPYPPGNVKINSIAYPGDMQGPVVLTWAHRDRLQQLSEPLLTQASSSIGPEVGTTYTVRVIRTDLSVVRTVASITGTTWTYTDADALADVQLQDFTLELFSVRDGTENWQRHNISIARHGFGFRFGEDFGGII